MLKDKCIIKRLIVALASIFSLLLICTICRADNSGVDGGIRWVIDNEGLLTISGSGPMKGYGCFSYYDNDYPAPWGTGFSRLVICEGVTSIGKYAFYDCEQLESVTLPNSLRTIGNFAFRECSNLTSVEIPNGVTTIGQGAFRLCSKLESIIIPDSVISIGPETFDKCSVLQEIDIPQGLTSIGWSAFGTYYQDCPAIRYAQIGSNGAKALGQSGYSFRVREDPLDYKYVFPEESDDELCVIGIHDSVESLTVPEGVIRIEDEAFSGADFINISLPNSLLYIDGSAFKNCYSLIAVEIPDNVSYIGYSAFDSCIGLTSVKLPDGLDSIGSYVFQNCYGLTDVYLPKDLVSLSYGLFNNCSGLVDISIPNDVTSIGAYAFYNCSSLQSISIPNGVTSINDSTFYNCSSLESISIPDGIERIGYSAFYNCSSLTALIIPSSLTSIGSGAFDKCGPLIASIDTDEARVVSRAGYGFRPISANYDLRYVYDWEDNEILSIVGADKNATSIVIPAVVTDIASEAFRGCDSLESIFVPDTLQSVGYNAFLGCSAVRYANKGSDGAKALSRSSYSFREPENDYDILHLFSENEIVGLEICSVPIDVTSFTIPDDITSIGGSAFEDCSSLSSIIIPNTVKNIKRHAFYNCSNLKEIQIPDDITSVAFGAFENCGAILHLFVNRDANAALVLSKAGYYFHYTGLNYNLKYVFDGDSATGLELNYIEHDMSSCEILPGVTRICDSAFYESRNLTNVFIPDSVITIGTNAFRYCSELTSITIPENVETIGNYAFRYCTKLKSVAIMSESIDFGSSVFSSSPTIYCHKFSDVDVWASQQGYKIVYFEDVEEETIRTVKLPQVDSLACGESAKLFADVFPATGLPVLWESDHPEIATVSDGLVTAISQGSATITAIVGSVEASVIVECYQPATKIELSETEMWIQAKQNFQLIPYVIAPAEATVQAYGWNSSDATLASVTGEGFVTTIKPGDVIISATTEKGVSADCLIHLCYPVETIQFNDINTVNRRLQLVATVTTQDHVYENKLVTFSSSDESVLTVDKDGIVYGKTAGKAIVTAVAYNGISATIELTVVTPMGKLILPANLKTIEDEAFVNIQDTVIYLPEGIEFISSTAFDPSVTIICKVNGYAYNRCKDLGLAVLGE